MKWLSYEEAKEFVSKLNIKSKNQWVKYVKSGNKPDNIPSTPSATYKNIGWLSWGDFLGTGRSRSKWLTYEEAKEFVSKLKIKSRNEWQEYVKSGNKPDNIPSNLNQTYKNKGWISWGEFLGTGTIHGKFKEYLSYEEAKEFVSKLNLKTQKEWFEYSKSENKPDNIPADPYNAYKNKGWISWSEFLNKGLKDSKNRKYMSYQEAKEFVSKLNLKSQTEWFQYCKSGNKPDNIPFNPQVFYKLKK